MNPADLDRILWRTSKQAPQHEQTVVLNTENGQLRIRDSGGAKPMVVFLCDPPVTIEAYDKLISLFESEYRIVVIELPGFGFSKATSSKAYEFNSSVIAIESAITELDPKSLVICGSCICGFVAAELVRRGNLDVSGLVLMQTPDVTGMSAWTDRADPKGWLRTKYIGQLIARAVAKNHLTAFWFGYATPKEYDHLWLTSVTLRALNAGASYPLATMLQTWLTSINDQPLEIPALVIWGKRDRSHKNTNPESTLKHVPNARTIELEDCGHFSELENPEKFYQLVVPFFRSCTGKIGA